MPPQAYIMASGVGWGDPYDTGRRALAGCCQGLKVGCCRTIAPLSSGLTDYGTGSLLNGQGCELCSCLFICMEGQVACGTLLGSGE